MPKNLNALKNQHTEKTGQTILSIYHGSINNCYPVQVGLQLAINFKTRLNTYSNVKYMYQARNMTMFQSVENTCTKSGI